MSKEAQEKVVESLQRWQKIENAAVAQTAKVMDETDNVLIRLVMEIIQRDSNMHYRVQQLLIDHLTRSAVTISPRDLEAVWDAIEDHIKIERRTVELANEALEALSHDKQAVPKYLLTYLLEDEKKHDKMLEDIVLIKRGMYP